MNSKELYAITGLFESSDDVKKAAGLISEAGYIDYDVNAPHPIHGIEKKMKLGHSSLGWFALFFGLLGTSTALFFMWWVSTIDYRLNVGGKPFFAFPAFLPITFELTVLLASIGTVATMIFVYFKLPNNSHPLNGTEYMKNVSSDKFGVCILKSDPIFDIVNTSKYLESIGAFNISPIYWDEDEVNFKPKFWDKKFMSLLIGVIIVTAGTTYFCLNIMLELVPFNWMQTQLRLPAQSQTDFFSDTRSMRTPPEKTVQMGYLPYQFSKESDTSEIKMTNPLVPTKENLVLGENKFNIFCSPCHGFHAKGDSRLNGQFPNPPTLHSDKIRNANDGIIFHIISVGQNVMPSYSKQLTSEEKWAIILHIRALQRAENAKEEDLK